MKKKASGAVAFVDDHELDEQWYALPNPRGTLHLGKTVKLSFEVRNKSLIQIAEDPVDSKGPHAFVDRAEVMREKKKCKGGVHDIEDGKARVGDSIQQEADEEDIFAGTGMRAGIGHVELSYSERARVKAKERYNSIQ
jgi:hypothetical protein